MKSDDIKVFSEIILSQQKQLEKANAANQSLRDGLEKQESILINAALDFKKEIQKRDIEIQDLHLLVNTLQSRISTLENTLMRTPAKQAATKGTEFDEYKFLRIMNGRFNLSENKGCRRISHVLSLQDNTHYEVVPHELHSNEEMLSRLRVRLYDQYRATPDLPLLVCSCCRRPVFLSGNSGIKGEIVGFRHVGEGNALTGEHVGESYNLPKAENLQELDRLKKHFLKFSPFFGNIVSGDSFLSYPGSDRRKTVGDITFSYMGRCIAVIFASAGHPLDFIIRREKAAHEKGFLPIWILSPSHFDSSAMSNRDISTFSKGYVCSIDDALSISEQNGEPCLLARNYYNNTFSFIRLSSFIIDAEESLTELMRKPEWNSETKPKRPRFVRVEQNTIAAPTRIKTEIPRKETVKVASPRQRKPVSITDYWKGKRFPLKGDLFIEKLDSGFGIIDMKSLRYPVLPIYDDIRISEDKSEVTLFLNGKEEQTIRI